MDMNVPKASVGMDYVPYDDYLVKLHKGEAVVQANAASELRKISPNFYSSGIGDASSIEFVNAIEKSSDRIVSAVKGDEEISPMIQQGPKQYNIKNLA